ncbi:MAG: RHS repeat-associated core domain-containing protein [Ilumatobacteraceae bacterium]
MFLNNRHYNPTTGVFVSVDPLVTKTGQPYIYGAANPIAFSDPSGLCIEPGSLKFKADGSYSYTPMGGPECYDASHDGHQTTGLGKHAGGYGVSSVPGPVTHGPGRAFTGLTMSDIFTWDNAVSATQVGLAIGTLTPCSVWCATAGATIATYQAIDTCDDDGWGTNCGVSIAAAGVSWTAAGSFAVTSGSSSAMRILADDAAAMAARSTVNVTSDSITIGSRLTATRGVISSSGYYYAAAVNHAVAPWVVPSGRLDLVLTGVGLAFW